MTELARITTLDGLLDACRDRRKALGLPQILVDELSGLQNGYTGKLEAGIKGLGKTSIPLLLGALKLELVVMPTTSGHRGELRHSEDFFSRRARKAVMARYAKQTPKQRKKAARAAAKVRWARHRAAQAERTES